MMKQPADNPNATPIEEKLAAERINPIGDPAQECAEIEAEAKRLALERHGEESCNPEEWERATEIVRNRRKAISKA